MRLGYLKPSTMKMLWSPVELTKCGWDVDGGAYGMGWGVMSAIDQYGCGRQRPFYVSHTGGAIGCSSVLLVMPTDGTDKCKNKASPPRGIVVAIMANMQAISLNQAALKIASIVSQQRKQSAGSFIQAHTISDCNINVNIGT